MALLAAAGCGSTPAPHQTLTLAPEGTAAATATATASATIGLVARPEAITDPTNDLVDEKGSKAKRNPHLDLTRLEAEADGIQLRVTMTVDGNIPARIPSTRQELNYVVEVEASGSQSSDYWLLITNLESGAWYAALTDWAGNSAEEDNEFPGTLVVAGNHMVVSVPLAVLGRPTRVRMLAVTQRADHKTGNVVAEDQVPSGDQEVPSNRWLTLTGS